MDFIKLKNLLIMDLPWSESMPFFRPSNLSIFPASSPKIALQFAGPCLKISLVNLQELLPNKCYDFWGKLLENNFRNS